MPPVFRVARKQLSYPLYGADFDPLNSDFLLVGGGGGSTSSGVPNKITLLDASRADTVNEITDIDLAKNEDSVTSLAIVESTEGSLTAYAGINSSIKDQEAGKNEHFRCFRVGLPARKRQADGSEKSGAGVATGTIKSQALSRTALFKAATGPKNDVYQRVLRVAPPHKDEGIRVAAIASGLATKNEVLVFRATPSPGISNIISRIDVEHGEAADLDIAPVEDEAKSYVLAYCTDYDVYLQHIPVPLGKGVKEPIKVHSTPTGNRRTKIRCLRWLNSRYMLLLCNRPAGGGSELIILKTDKDYTQAQQTLIKTLTKTTKQAVGLATAPLSASPNGEQQFVVAIAGQDSSVEILTVDYVPGSGMIKFKHYDHLQNVHSGPITRITFANFRPPSLPVTKDTKPQYIRLATVGVDLNVLVFTFPLRPYPAVYSKEPRYVLISPPQTMQNAINITIALLLVTLVAFCMQVFCEIRGILPPTLKAQSWLSPGLQQKFAVPYPWYSSIPTNNLPMPGPVIPESLPPVLSSVSSIISATHETATQAAEAGATYLQDLIAEQALNPHQQIVMRDTADQPSEGGEGSLGAEIHHRDSDTVKKDESIKKWDQLSEKEKRGWKKRLIEAGHWTEKQGETILKGILFSELAGAVGAAVRG